MVVKTDSGEMINDWCHECLFTVEINTEAVLDILDVYTRMIKIDIKKTFDPKTKLLKDVVLEKTLPSIDEDVIKLAMTNVKEFHKIRKEFNKNDIVAIRRTTLMKRWQRMLK